MFIEANTDVIERLISVLDLEMKHYMEKNVNTINMNANYVCVHLNQYIYFSEKSYSFP